MKDATLPSPLTIEDDGGQKIKRLFLVGCPRSGSTWTIAKKLLKFYKGRDIHTPEVIIY